MFFPFSFLFASFAFTTAHASVTNEPRNGALKLQRVPQSGLALGSGGWFTVASTAATISSLMNVTQNQADMKRLFANVVTLSGVGASGPMVILQCFSRAMEETLYKMATANASSAADVFYDNQFFNILTDPQSKTLLESRHEENVKKRRKKHLEEKIQEFCAARNAFNDTSDQEAKVCGLADLGTRVQIAERFGILNASSSAAANATDAKAMTAEGESALYVPILLPCGFVN